MTKIIKDPYKYEDINFEIRRALIKSKEGKIIFDEEVEFPEYFSDDSVNIVSSKYLCNEAKRKENSIKQMIDRVSETIAMWGMKDGYFKTEEDKQLFENKLKYYQIHQYFAFNSPVYFNCGLVDKPQTSACFILDIEDDMESIMDSVKMESIIFKGGSGTGINMSPLRSSKERVRGGGFASGPCSFWKIGDTAAGVVKSGGTLRRSAKLVCLDISHPDCMKFIQCKKLEENKMRALIDAGIQPEEGYEMSDAVFYQNTNISLVIPDDYMRSVEHNKEWWTRYVLDGEKCEKFNADLQLQEIAKLTWETGDPGLQFSDNINKWNTCANSGRIMSTNPCVTGDTMIYTVYDGPVPIKELADVGKDVLIYSFDKKSREVKISNGVHPRKTGEHLPVYKITLDDGTSFRATSNHKLVTRIGKEKEVCELSVGDSLMPIKLVRQKNDDINSYSCGETFKEHILLAEYKYDRKIDYNNGEVVHHEDGNHSNNKLDNIIVKTHSDHSRDHITENNPMQIWWPEATPQEKDRYRKNMSLAKSAENNGRYLGISNEEVKEHAINLTKQLNREFTIYDWYEYSKNNNVPEFKAMSKWRKINLNGGLTGLSKWAAYKCGKNILESSQRVKKVYYNMLEQGYNPEIINETVYVHRTCEKCGKDFIRHYYRRELCFCKSCSSKMSNIGKIIPQDQKDRIRANVKKIWNIEDGKENRRKSVIESTKNKAMACGNMLLFLNKEINREDWNSNKELLKDNGIKKFIQRDIIDKYWNNNWNTFITDCNNYNHKIVSVEFDGYEDVYNITTEKYHTFIIATNINEAFTSGIVSSNCGEFAFLNNSSCNLASINLLKFFSIDDNNNILFDSELFEDVVNTVIIGQDILVDRSSFPNRKITNNTHNFRPLGLGYSNLGALLMWLGLPYDSDESRNITSLLTALLTGYAYKTSNELSTILQNFQKFEENEEPFYKVLNQHNYYIRKQLDKISTTFNIKKDIVGKLANDAKNIWDHIINLVDAKSGFRNSQVTLLAPTGTISFMMDCVTKGIEPEYSLISYKTLSGNEGATIKIVNSIVKDSLYNLGYTKNEVDSLCDELHSLGHFENSEILKKEHLPIFDTAVSPKGGSRCINYMGHVKMVAAAQPFLSGAISKTINMHNSVTPHDIYNLFKFAWGEGLKGITVYRDGSKTFQPLNKTDQKKSVKKENKYDIATRKKLPDDRPGNIHKFSIGSTKGYLMTGSYKDGSLGEIFLTVAKQGSTLSGLLDSLAIMISTCLQYGVPLKDIVSNLIYSKFDPSGITSNRDIKFTTSIVDYIARFLGLRYLSEEEKFQLGLTKQKPKETKKVRLINPKFESSAPSCEVCGGIMQRLGTCYNCNNCGANTGSCG